LYCVLLCLPSCSSQDVTQGHVRSRAGKGVSFGVHYIAPPAKCPQIEWTCDFWHLLICSTPSHSQMALSQTLLVTFVTKFEWAKPFKHCTMYLFPSLWLGWPCRHSLHISCHWLSAPNKITHPLKTSGHTLKIADSVCAKSVVTFLRGNVQQRQVTQNKMFGSEITHPMPLNETNKITEGACGPHNVSASCSDNNPSLVGFIS
jgi:hypothetical protein